MEEDESMDIGDEEITPPVAPDIEMAPKGEVYKKVHDVLEFMKRTGINLEDFLDALLWGDKDCRTDKKMSAIRENLTHGKKLPGILQRMYNVPRKPSGGGKRSDGARAPLEAFSLKVITEIEHTELHKFSDMTRLNSDAWICGWRNGSGSRTKRWLR